MFTILGFTMRELLFAAVVSFFITWFIVNITAFLKMLKRGSGPHGYLSSDINKIIERCYALFPLDKLSFRGQIYERGASIRITTAQQRIFEGELIGFNHRHMICIMTKRHIIAQDLDNVEEITVIDKVV